MCSKMLVIMKGDLTKTQHCPVLCIVRKPTGVGNGTGNGIETGQNLPHQGQTLPQLAQNLPHQGQTLLQLAQNLPHQGQTLPQLAQNLPHQGHTLPAHSGQSVSYLGQNLPPPPPLVRHGPTSISTPSIQEGSYGTIENMDFINNDVQHQSDQTILSDNFMGMVIAMKDGVECEKYAMCSNILTIGSAGYYDITIENAAHNKVLLQANKNGKVLIFRNDARLPQGLCLQHNQDFVVGNQWFKWKYPKGSSYYVDIDMDSINDVKPLCDKTLSEVLCQVPSNDCLDEMLDLKEEVIREVLEIERLGNLTDTTAEEMINHDVYNPDSIKDHAFHDPDHNPDCVEDNASNDHDFVPGNAEDEAFNDSDYEPDSEEVDSYSDEESDFELKNDSVKQSCVKAPVSCKSKIDMDKPDKSNLTKGITISNVASIDSGKDFAVDESVNSKNAAGKPGKVTSRKRATDVINSASSSRVVFKIVSSKNSVSKSSKGYLRKKIPENSHETEDFTVQNTNNSKDQRVWDKIHFCLYCCKSSTCITKHYLRSHKNEEDVKSILSLAKGSKERSLELIRLRNKGDYQHNMEVLSSRKGTLVSFTRRKNASVDDYLPCEDCLGFFLKDGLWRHRKSCPFKKSEAKYNKTQASAKLLIPSSENVNEGLMENVINKMTNDVVSVCAKTDAIIVKLAENLYGKNGQYQSRAICQKMRELARFLIIARKEREDIKSLSDIINPEMFEIAIEATRRLCGFNASTQCLTNPSLAMRIGSLLQKCSQIKKSTCLISKSSGREDAENFLTLLQNEWTSKIGSNAVQTVSKSRVRRVQILPEADDIKILTDHLKETAEKCLMSLSQDFKKSDWEMLNKVTLIRLVLFNSKRDAEVEMLKVVNYHARKTNSRPSPIIESTLSPVEKVLCSKFERVEMRGKKGRKVAILLTPEMQRCIDVLLMYRAEAGVNPNNDFVFASAYGYTLNPLQRAVILRTFCSSLNLSAKEGLTNAKLSRHGATLAQIFSLSRSDVEVLISVLGHDIHIQQSSNQLPLSTIQVAKVVKLLSAFDNGTIAKYSGLPLDEIPLDEADDSTVHDGDASQNETGNGVHGSSVLIEDPQDGPEENTVLFGNITSVNHGFFKLFSQFKLVDSTEQASILVVPSDSNAGTSYTTLRLFTCLLGRKTRVISDQWIKDSLMIGEIQNMDDYRVLSADGFGEFSVTENYGRFEFQIKGTNWLDIKEDDMRSLLKKMGGIEALTVSDKTVIVCADGESHLSGQCVSKDWVFQCIIDGKINPLPRNIDNISDSDDAAATKGYSSCMLGKKIHVQSAGTSNGTKPLKKQACIYCGKLCTKLSRHLSVQHSEQDEVARILNLEKNSHERRNAWIKLALKGNFAHNQKVKENGSGLLIPKKRPVKNTADSKYLPCEYCLAFIIDKDLCKHHKSCISKPKDVKSDGPMRNSKLLLQNICSDELFKDVVSKLRDDDVTSKIKSDDLILEFGQRQYNKIGKHIQNYQRISQKMRDLAKILIAIQKKDHSVTALMDVISAPRWKDVIETLKKEAGFNVELQEYERPWFAMKCGLSLKRCAVILRNKCNENGDEITREKAVRFLEMYEEEWYELVGAKARESVNARKRNKVKFLPLVKDVIKLFKHIDIETEKLKNTDCSGSKEEAYVRMCKLSLAQVILFNRGRVDEAQSLTIEAYNKASLSAHVDEDVKKSLSKLEQELCNSLVRVETEGNSGRKVTILFTPAIHENIKSILGMQESLGCSSKYVFAPFQGLKPYCGLQVLKEISQETDLMYATRITSTNRKQLSALSQVLCLSKDNQDLLAKFIGHNVSFDSHTKLNGLPEKVAKVARLLHLLNIGKVPTVTENTLEDINVDLILEDEDTSEREDTNEVNLPRRSSRKQGQKRNLVEQDEIQNNNGSNEETQQPPVAKKRLRQRKKLVDRDDFAYVDDSEDETWQPPGENRRQSVTFVSSSSDDSDDLDDQQTMTRRKKVIKKKFMTSVQREATERAFKKNILSSKVPGKEECLKAKKSERVLSRFDWKKLKFAVYNIIQKNKKNSNHSKSK